MRTEKEIQAEIAALEDCLTFAPRRSALGDENHRNIRLQIRVLKGELDPDSEDTLGAASADLDAILEAKYWLDGDEEEAPSAGWQIFRRDT